ncbi:hypothetical protein ACWD62_21065, partial [Streptomyces sp. NPDC005146]
KPAPSGDPHDYLSQAPYWWPSQPRTAENPWGSGPGSAGAGQDEQGPHRSSLMVWRAFTRTPVRILRRRGWL